MESFASVDPAGPANPKLGQLWYQLDAGGPGFHALNILRSESPIEWTLITSDTFNLPGGLGNPGDFIQTDGAGNLSFAPGQGILELFEDPSPVLADDLDANAHKIINLITPTADTDAANKFYVDDTITTTIASLDLITLAGGVFVSTAGEVANDGAATMAGLIFNDNGSDIDVQLVAAGRLITNTNYLPTRQIIDAQFLRGEPYPIGSTPATSIAQKYDEQILFDAEVPEAQLLDNVGNVVVWNVSVAQAAHLDLNSSFGGNVTIAAASNIQDGGTYIIIVKQDATGGRAITFTPGAYRWPDGIAPTPTITANAVDIFSFISDGTIMYGVGQTNFS